MPEFIKEIQKQYPTKKLEIWTQDEARVGQHGTINRLWTETGTRPRVFRDCRFEYAYIFGAICPALKKGSALVFSGVGAEEMSLHLKEISKSLAEDAHAAMIMDRAPWHKAVTVPENISIIYLPPYSPELNPTEQIWDYLRSNYLSNRVYETLEEVFDACCEAWNLLVAQPDVIASIGTRAYFTQD